MSAKKLLVFGSALLLSACASSAMIDETGDIANQFCLSNENPHSEARKLLLSPSLTRAMKIAKMRHGVFVDETPPPEVVPQTATAPAEADMMPPHFDSAHNEEAVEAIAKTHTTTYAPVAICTPGRAFTMNKARYAEIHHAPASGGSGWTDRLVLTEIDGKWMIDDILFAPDYRRSMRETLIRTE